MTTELVDLIAKKFIARPDVKAQQHSSGDAYFPVVDRYTKERLPWTREDLEAHLAGQKTFGHYMVSQDNECKLFAFDVDLRKNEKSPDGRQVTWSGSAPIPSHYGEVEKFAGEIIQFDPRLAWQDRAHPARDWMKYQFRMVAHLLCSVIEKELDIPCAAAYSGSKGIHVYGFTGLMSAADVRAGAEIALDALAERPYCDGVEPYKGKHFFKFKNDDPIEGYPNLSIEVFPKQENLDSKDVGNLMRLPLGRNFKSEDPTFFIDMTSALNDLVPVDPIHALTSTSPFKMPGE